MLVNKMRKNLKSLNIYMNIYTVYGRKRFFLPATYFSTNLVYPFTLRVTGIKTKIYFATPTHRKYHKLQLKD